MHKPQVYVSGKRPIASLSGNKASVEGKHLALSCFAAKNFGQSRNPIQCNNSNENKISLPCYVNDNYPYLPPVLQC